MEEVIRTIKKERESAGLSQAQFARIINMDRQRISAYESGAKNMSPKMINRLLDVFGLECELIYHIKAKKDVVKKI